MTLIADALKRATKEVCAKSGINPADVNKGWCDRVAEMVATQLPAAVISTEGLPEGEGLPPHWWVRWRGRHYDAHCLVGVRDFHELPIFLRGD